jgi:uncharacterized Ntn-hydrolase superfamily protein
MLLSAKTIIVQKGSKQSRRGRIEESKMTDNTQIKRPVHTYSIVARDKETAQLGVAVQSHYFGVGPIVPWAEAGVGAVALAGDEEREVRQVAMIDAQGHLATHTGTRSIAAAGHLSASQLSVQANLMV